MGVPVRLDWTWSPEVQLWNLAPTHQPGVINI